MGCLCYGRRLEERLQKGFLKTPGSWEGQGLGLGLWWRDWGCLQPGDFMALEQSRGAAELWWMCSFVDGCPAKLCLSILYLSTQDKFFHIHSNVDWISLLSQVTWHAEDISTTLVQVAQLSYLPDAAWFPALTVSMAQYERRNLTSSPKQKPFGHGSEAAVLAELNICLFFFGSYHIEEILEGEEAIKLAPGIYGDT